MNDEVQELFAFRLVGNCLFSDAKKTRDKSRNTKIICSPTCGKLLFSDTLKTMDESHAASGVGHRVMSSLNS